jgi:hypothetical protein
MAGKQMYRCLQCRRELQADEQPCPYYGNIGREIIISVEEKVNIEEGRISFHEL